jgi:hypothetical protein
VKFIFQGNTKSYSSFIWPLHADNGYILVHAIFPESALLLQIHKLLIWILAGGPAVLTGFGGGLLHFLQPDSTIVP